MTAITANTQETDELGWMSSRLKIVDKTPRLIPFVPNPHQERLYALMNLQRRAGFPVRIIILKARQLGISTGVEAYMFARAHLRDHHFAFVCAHNDDASTNLFRMNRRFYEHLPEGEKRKTLHSSRKEIEWAEPHGSRISVQTAGNEHLQRGSTLMDVHCSEVAMWPNPENTMTALLQCVPNSPDTTVIIECTANGIGNEFYRRWVAAVEAKRQNPTDLSGFYPLFIPWVEETSYAGDPPPDYHWGLLTGEESALETLGVTRRQLYWRRGKIKDDFNGSVERFHQEHPFTPDEAFLASGRPAIPHPIIRHHRSCITKPLRARLFWDDDEPNGVGIEYGEFPLHYWQVWQSAETRHDYCIGADVAEGKLSDPNNAQSEPDRSSAIVLDRGRKLYTALFLDRLPPDALAEELLKAAYFWNMAWLGPEANGPGLLTLRVIREENYANIYRREREDDALELAEVDKLGWLTTMKNRDPLIDSWIAACRSDQVNGFSGKLLHHSADMVAEEETFVYNERGKREHRPGGHDDILFAAFIAWEMNLALPRLSPMAQRRRTFDATEMSWEGSVDTAADILGPDTNKAESTV
jgi:hypothetical protein